MMQTVKKEKAEAKRARAAKQAARRAALRKIPPQTMSVGEAAARLGVSEERAYRAIALGQIPTILIGDRRVVPIAAFEKMLGGV
jgi:excisionase family DNA binding protein